MNRELNVAEVLVDIFGHDVWDDQVGRTAKRIVQYWQEFSTTGEPDFKITTFQKNGIDQMVAVKDLEFSSLCAHHLLPFYGKAHVAYIPNDEIVGLSKIPRVIDHYAHRPQVQERLTKEIADYFYEQLEPRGVGVVIEATHTCMSCRGVRKQGGKMVTSEVRGALRDDGAARNEFLRLML